MSLYTTVKNEDKLFKAARVKLSLTGTKNFPCPLILLYHMFPFLHNSCSIVFIFFNFPYVISFGTSAFNFCMISVECLDINLILFEWNFVSVFSPLAHRNEIKSICLLLPSATQSKLQHPSLKLYLCVHWNKQSTGAVSTWTFERHRSRRTSVTLAFCLVFLFYLLTHSV